MRDQPRRPATTAGPRKVAAPDHRPSSKARSPAPTDGRGLLTPTTLLDLQRTAGNAAVSSVMVVQRGLIPLDAQSKPGRLRDEETTLKDLLAANGFTLLDRQKARSDGAHETDLKDRMDQVLAVEAKFTHGSNVDAAKRRAFRSELAAEYDQLVHWAGVYRDDANAAYDAALTAEAGQIRLANPTVNELFKAGDPWKVAEPLIVLPARLAKFAVLGVYVEAVRTRYKKLYKDPAVAPGAGLSLANQGALATEKTAVGTQLTAWQTKRWDAAGCNANGTWGTSAGAGAGFAATHLNAAVWGELRTWWLAKPGAYITPSDTSTWSLKKFRALAANSQLSRTFNYHVWVP